MAKTKSVRRIRPGMGVKEYSPHKALLDRDRIGRALLKCLEAGDHEGYLEVLKIYLNAVRRDQASRDEVVSAPVKFSANPMIRTIAQQVHQTAAATI